MQTTLKQIFAYSPLSSPPVSSITISLVLHANVSLGLPCFDISDGKYVDDRELLANQRFVTPLRENFFKWVGHFHLILYTRLQMMLHIYTV